MIDFIGPRTARAKALQTRYRQAQAATAAAARKFKDAQAVLGRAETAEAKAFYALSECLYRETLAVKYGDRYD